MGDIGRLTLCPGSPYWDASWHPKPSIHVSLINCESEVWRPKADEPNSDPGTVPGFADQLWILISSDQCSTTINDQLWSTPHRPTDGLFTRVPTIARTELAAPCGHFVKTDFLLIWECWMKWFLFLFEWEEGRIPGIWKQLFKLVHMYIHVMYLGPWAVKCTSICPKVQFSYQLPQRQAYILYRLDFPIVFFLNHHLALADPSFPLPKCPRWTAQMPTTLPKCPQWTAQSPTTLLTCFPRCAPRASPQSDQPSTWAKQVEVLNGPGMLMKISLIGEADNKIWRIWP